MPDMKLETPEDVLREVAEICSPDNTGLVSMLHREAITNALKFKRDGLETLDLKIINRAMDEFRYAARTFKPYRSRRKASIFGSARTPEDDPYYQSAVVFARQLVERGFMVITGASDGIMRAGNVGAGAESSFGANILLPSEQEPNEVMLDNPKLITFRYFFTRKLFFVMEADAVALFPGGFGTHDEGFETLTLLQTGKARPMPFVLMELPGEDYWEDWDRFIRKQMLSRELISEEDLSLYKIVDSPEDGVEWITSFYYGYHSMRQVRDVLILRLEKNLTDAHLEELNDEFRDLVVRGRMAKVEPHRVEADEPHLAAKPRISFLYNRSSAGRLTQMILAINRMAKTLPDGS